MCLAKVGKIVELNGNKAIVKFGKTFEEIDVSLVKGLKVGDKIICSGKIGVEKED